MITWKRFVVFAVLAAFVAFAPVASAQTTGRVIGKITDSTGGALPGVNVTITSPSLQGARTVTTDAGGTYRFVNLPPGAYAVKAELANFKTAEQQKIEVGIDRTIEVNLVLAIGSVTENVTVTGASPVIDTTSATSGLNAKPEMFNRLPTRRDFYAIAQLAPGTSADATGTTVSGSTGAENQYIIEGLNTTGIETGRQGKTLNFDFVQDVEVKTGGLPAEYGRMTGGVINVITKSGGNEFHGSGFGFAEGGPLQSKDSTRALREQTVTTVVNTAHLWDVGFNLGGYVMKDRLWFFGAVNPTNRGNETTIIRPLSTPGSPALNSTVPQKVTSTLYSVKFTYKLTAGQNVVFSAFGDPGKTVGNVFGIAGPPSTWLGTAKTGGSDMVVRYDAVFGGSTLLHATYGHHKETNKLTGDGSSTARFTDQTVTPNVNSGGFGTWSDTDFGRDVAKIDFSKFLGGHELKTGADYEHVTSAIGRFSGGAGQSIQELPYTCKAADVGSFGCASTGQSIIYYRHRYFVNDRAAGFDRANPATWVIADPLFVTPADRNFSFYAQDSWRIANQLTINAGLRIERQEVLSRDGVKTIDLKWNKAPRLGAIWDLTGNGRSKLYVNWGRFYENVPMDINIRAFGGELTAFSYNFNPSASAFQPAPVGTTPSKSSVLGTPTEPVDPAIKGQYIDEVLVGFEKEIGSNFSVGIKYAHRNLGRIIEDFLVPSEGAYFIANPTLGTLGKEMTFYDGSTIAAVKPVRKYDSIELSATKRYSNGWQLMANYVWSKLEGNYDGVFQVSTGQLDPNINSAYDYADFMVNAQGPLSNDRTHAIKLNGSYEVQKGPIKGFNVGAGFHWFSGYPLNAYGYSTAYANWEYALVPRGSVGRGPREWEGDLHASYPIRLGGSRRIDAIVDIFNLFNRQAIVRPDERYNLISDGKCAGVVGCNSDGGLGVVPGTLTPLVPITNPQATATNPDYLKAGNTFTGQRSIRVGVRFLF